MRRVASLYLPFLPTDRIRWIGAASPKQPEPAEAPPPLDFSGLPTSGNPLKDCSCPRGGGWRPGARWAKVEAEIARLPAHQRPTRCEIGRLSEAAEMPFKHIGRAPFAPKVAVQGQPLVTTARDGQKMVIAAACPEAKVLGLMPGMGVSQARAMIPALDIRECDPEGDAALLARIGDYAARRITPLVAISGADGLWLDLTGAAHLHGGEERLCRRLIRLCARLGLQARIAVAGHAATAHALARHGSEPLIFCPPGGEEAALAPLPLPALRLEPKLVDKMRRLGLEWIGDLIAMPRGPLLRRFGREMVLRLEQALGRTAEPFDPIVPRDAPIAEIRFAEPIGGAETIARAITALVDDLEQTLREAALGARVLLLVCDRVDKSEARVEVGAARATRDKPHLLRMLTRKIETIDPGFGIDAMRLIAARTEPLGAHYLAGDLAAPQETPELAQLIDLIAGRIGAKNLYRFTGVESEVPERSVVRAGPLDTPAPWPDAWPRPARLLPRPEPIANVVSELPDAPPRRFTWRGRTHIIVAGDGPERIYGEWWKRGRERDAVRDYFQVEDDSGARFWLFRKGDGDDDRTGDLSWWIQGAFG